MMYLKPNHHHVDINYLHYVLDDKLPAGLL